jgi:hypothetical protein
MFTLPYRAVVIKRQDGEGGLFRFDFSELQQHLNIMSGTPSRVRLLQNCFERHSGHEMEAFNEFQLRIEETAA